VGPGGPPASVSYARPTVSRPAVTIAPSAGFRSRVAAALRSTSNWAQLAKFCTVGAVGYGVNLAVYAAILHEGVHYLAAATCSFLVAVTSNYTWNRLWTFRDHRGGVATQGLRFFAVSLASLGANLLVLDVLVRIGAGKFLAQAVAIVLVTPLNFVGNKLWSFRRGT
jgi:putative flippase GtrA